MATIWKPQNKSFTRFFSCEGCPPPVCLRCSPGLFRQDCAAVSCHTYSMAANAHLVLTKNSSPTTLANGRRTAQIAVSKGRAFGRAAHGAKSPNRSQRHPQMAQSPAIGHGFRRRPCGVDGGNHISTAGLLCQHNTLPIPKSRCGKRPQRLHFYACSSSATSRNRSPWVTLAGMCSGALPSLAAKNCSSSSAVTGSSGRIRP